MPKTQQPKQWTAAAAALAATFALAACGGSSNADSPSGSSPTPAPANGTAPAPSPSPSPAPAPSSGLPASSSLAQQCSPHNPFVADAEGPTTVADLDTEKRWLRSYFDESYLWYRDVPNVDAGHFAFSNDTNEGFSRSLNDYFNALVVTDKDRFSFQYPTRLWNSLFQSGVQMSTGIEWAKLSTSPPRQLRASLVYPNSTAAAAGVQRGDTLVSVNGHDFAKATDQAALDVFKSFVSGVSQETTYTVVFSRQGKVLPAMQLTAKSQALPPVTQSQVLTQANGDKVGYMVFNSHIAPAEAQLIQSVQDFKSAGIKDLVLDLRYNGGGYVYIASQLAYMIAGPARTENKIFEQEQFNDKRSSETSQSITPFFNVSCLPNGNGRCTEENALPSLDLPRVYVLTSDDTCSASESVINGLEGVDIQVHRVGGTTCGKPYGFAARDNCGMSNFAIEFSGVNAKGFGDYADGFTAQCDVVDDLDHALGDPAEAQLAGALTLRSTGQCPSTAARSSALSARAPTTGPFASSPIKSAKILSPLPRH